MWINMNAKFEINIFKSWYINKTYETNELNEMCQNKFIKLWMRYILKCNVENIPNWSADSISWLAWKIAVKNQSITELELDKKLKNEIYVKQHKNLE